MDFPERWKSLWNIWDLRVFIPVSLSLQIVLICAGSLRKRIATWWISFWLWLAYLLADWVAVFALGILSNNNNNSDNKDSSNESLLAFWSPFLLLHLGGPDTITAFALEDNELWLRHLLQLLFQVGIALYVFVRSVPDTKLGGPAALMFVAAMIKYGERTLALMRASMNPLRNSMVTTPDPGPNYAKFMEEYASKEKAGVPVVIHIEKEPESGPRWTQDTDDSNTEPLEPEAMLSDARRFYNIFRRLIVDLILTFHDRNESQALFLKLSHSQAFNMVEIELSYIYDDLYSKSLVIHTAAGPILRGVTVFSTLAALLIFIATDKEGYERIDVWITYVLLGVALVLEICAVIILVLSDWCFLALHRKNCWFAANIVLKGICLLRPPSKPRWCNSIAQYNLLAYCVRDLKLSSPVKKAMSLLDVKDMWDVWDVFWHTMRVPASEELKKQEPEKQKGLKEFIFEELKEKAKWAEDSKEYKRLSSCRGEWTLLKKGCHAKLGWSVQAEFDESILLWHIATDLCYHTEPEPSNDDHKECRRMSGEISNYMLYLLVGRPFMLPPGIGQIRYGDTCAEAKHFFKEAPDGVKKACEMLLEVRTDEHMPTVQVKGDRSKSVLFDACRLAHSLNTLNEDSKEKKEDSKEKTEGSKNENFEKKKKWSLIRAVWIEMLGYAASNCSGYFHAKQLSAGGELFTHVWLLMAHLGIGKQYRIEAGHARAKLIVDK